MVYVVTDAFLPCTYLIHLIKTYLINFSQQTLFDIHDLNVYALPSQALRT